MSENFKLVIGVMVLLIKDGKVCLVRRCNTGYSDGNYSLPSGRVENGEMIKEAGIRETKEEVGVDIQGKDLNFTCFVQIVRQNGEVLDFAFKTEKWDGEIKNCEPDKCDCVEFFPLDKLPDNLTINTKKAIEGYLKGQVFCELKDYM